MFSLFPFAYLLKPIIYIMFTLVRACLGAPNISFVLPVRKKKRENPWRHLSNWMIFAIVPMQADSGEEMISSHSTAQTKSTMLRYNGFDIIG